MLRFCCVADSRKIISNRISFRHRLNSLNYSVTNLPCEHRESCLQAQACAGRYGKGRTCDNNCADDRRCCNGCAVILCVLAFSSPLLALLSVPSELLCFTCSGLRVEQFLAVLQTACQALLIIHTLQRHSWQS